jgi:hypothetical protein
LTALLPCASQLPLLLFSLTLNILQYSCTLTICSFPLPLRQLSLNAFAMDKWNSSGRHATKHPSLSSPYHAQLSVPDWKKGGGGDILMHLEGVKA